MLQAMIKQRRESIALHEQEKRADLAQKEREEIIVIEDFLPASLARARSRPQQRRPLPRQAQQVPKTSARSWLCCASAIPASLTSGRPV